MAGTIAFSGLSGIDTSSWIDALVSVKQTTLTSLQSQQALKKTLLSTVNSIKSFFTSFQNALQKVTDAQFGISSMDLFMQNLAKSSNTNIVTATATTDAARQSYDVLVSQLATATKATSGYTQTVTKDVALDTTLGTLGVTAGTITVNNQSFSISKDDTLSTLITKFKNVGVTATLDTDTSKFTVSANVAGINDGTTGLKTALKLSDTPISGVTSGTLVYADTSTALSKLGLTGGAVTMNAAGGTASNYTITKNATNYSIQKGAGPATTITTLGDLFNYMTGTVGAESATIDSKGNISIQGAVITPVNGGSNILSALNLTQVVDRTVMKSGTLQVTNTHVADSSTTMAQLGITGTTTFVINGVSNSITSDKTIGNLETILNGAGVGASMSVDSNGVISINTNGATLGGTVLTSLGLNPTTEGTTIQSSAHTITNYATGSTLLSSLGVTNAMVYTAYKSDGTALTGTLNNNGSLTVDDFITKLKSNGLDASFDSTTGKITINDGYISGTAATQLGMGATNTSQTIIATGATTLSKLGATTDTNSLIINGTSTNYAKATSLTTIMNAITSAGGTATLGSDGTLKITGVTLGGTIPTLLGLSTTQQGTSVTSGALTYISNTTSTSSAGLTATSSSAITGSTQIGTLSTGESGKVYVSAVSSFVSGETYHIATTTDLDKLKNLTNSGVDTTGVKFVLDNDISYPSGGTLGIGTSSNAFKGTFDGNGHTISSYSSFSGLFGYINGATIENLGLSGSISNAMNPYSGLLVDSATNSTISNSYTTGTVSETATGAYGGLAGYISNCSLSNVYTTANVSGGSGSYVGGLAGVVTSSSNISNAYSSGTVSGTYVGDLFGELTSSTISNVYTTSTSSTNLWATSGGGLTKTNVVGISGYATGATAQVTLAQMKTPSIMQSYGFTQANGWYDVAGSTPQLMGAANGDTLYINGVKHTYTDATSLSTIQADIAAAGGTMTINSDSTVSVTGVNLQGGLTERLKLNSTGQGTVASSNSVISSGGLTVIANSSTTFSQLGATSGTSGSINGTNYNYSGSDTLSKMFTDISNSGGTASIDENGVISVKGVTLAGSLISSLGLSSVGQGTSVSSGALTYVSSTTSTGGAKNSTAVSVANGSSLLSSIVGTSGTTYTLSISGPSGTVVKNYTDNATTLATIAADVNSQGGSASIDSNGTLSVSGVKMSGTLLAALGAVATGQQGSTATGSTALTTGTTLASAGVLRVITNESNVVDLNYTAGTAISSVLSDLNALGISASVSSGHLVATSYDKSFTLSGSVGTYMMGGTGTTTNFDTAYTAENKTSTTVTTANTASILGNIGVTSGEIQIKNSLGVITGSIGVSDTMTVSQLQSSLSNYGFTMSVSGGKFTITSAKGNTLVDGTSNLTSVLGTTAWTNTNSSVAATTTMSQLGYTNGTAMSVLVDDSSLYQLSFGANDSVQDVMNTLATFGINSSVSAGVFSANSTEHTFKLTGDLAKTLTNGTAGYVNTPKSYTSQEEQYTTAVTSLSTSSTIASLLGDNTGGTLRLAINGSQIVSLTYGATDKISDVISDLSDLGINASVSSGIFAAGSMNETFVLSGDIGQALMGSNGTYSNISSAYKSDEVSEIHRTTASNSSTLQDLGISSGKIYIMDSSSNVVNSIDITNDMTISQVKSALLSNGFTMGIDGTGKVTVSSNNGYTLTDGSSDMVSKLGLTSWTNTTAKVTTGTTLSQLGYKDGTNLNILVDGTNSNSLSFGATDTVQSVINSLGALGITASVDTNGIFTASSTGHTFVMSGDLAATLTKGTTGYVNSDKGYTANVTYQGPYITDTSSQLKYTNPLSMSTTVASMGFADGGTIRLIEDGDTPYTLSFLATDTLQDVADTLSAYGINTSVDSNGKFTATSNTHSFTMGGALGTYLTTGGTYIDRSTGYVSSPETYNTTDNIKTTTKLSSLGVANGYLNIMKDGVVVSNNIQIDDSTTVGQLFSAMNVYGLTGQVLTDTNGKTYMKITSADGSYLADGTSNVVSKLGLNNINMGDYKGTLEYWDSSASSGLITNDMLLSSFDKNGYSSTGSLLFTTGSGDNAEDHIVNITSDDTVGTFLTKMQSEGVNAVLDNGVIKISNSVDGVTFTGGTSGVMNTLGLTSGNLYTYASSSSAVTYQGKDSSSVANYADGGTLLSTVNTTDGTLSLYVDGVKCSVNVSASDTFSALFGKIASSVAAKTGLTIKAGFVDTDGNIVTNPTAAQNTGVIAMQIADGHTLVVGASNDTSNFSTIANLSQDSTTEVKGTRALYKVNTSSTLTSSGLFKAGNITAGTFSIGDASFTIDANTTLTSLMTQINKSDKSYASAYWDTLSGTMVIQSTITGASLINIEAGTSNFTDIMGLTKNDSGTETLNTDSQTLGNNAIVEINGTKVISTSNTITSDISKVKGLTLNLKGVSTSTTPTTVTVSQDTDSIVSAVSDIVDSYNDMMDELDKALGTSSSSSSSSSTTTTTSTTSTGLETDTMLKMLKNSLKSLMTSSVAGLTTYKNLSAVGISTGDASDSISTDVTSLVFDKEKFLAALNANPDDVKKLLVGTSSSQGILLQAYNKVQSTLKSTGYISTLTNSTTKAISTLDNKISDMSDALTKYRAQLEKKFGAMDTIISKMQNSYSSLLGSSASSGLSSSS